MRVLERGGLSRRRRRRLAVGHLRARSGCAARRSPSPRAPARSSATSSPSASSASRGSSVIRVSGSVLRRLERPDRPIGGNDMDFELSDDQVALAEGCARSARAGSRSPPCGRWPTSGGVDRELLARAGRPRACSRCACPEPRAAPSWAGPTRCWPSRSSVGRSSPVRWCGPTCWPASSPARPRARSSSAASTATTRAAWSSTPSALDVLVVVDDDGVWSVDRRRSTSTPSCARSTRSRPSARLTGALPQGERIARRRRRRPRLRRAGRRAHRRPAARRGRGVDRPGRGLRQGPPAVRPPDRRRSRPQAPDGRHVHPGRGGPGCGLRRRGHPRRSRGRARSSGRSPRPS